MIAKFPRKDDEWPLTRWEATTLGLAERAAIEVPRWKLETIAKRAVLLLERFDRKGGRRIPFMSALTAVGGTESDGRSYIEIADALRTDGAEVTQDLRQLWRRTVFNILVSNTDDHEEDQTSSLANAMKVAPSFGISKLAEAKAIAKEVGSAVATWRDVATRCGLRKGEIERMASAFEHDDLRQALA